MDAANMHEPVLALRGRLRAGVSSVADEEIVATFGEYVRAMGGRCNVEIAVMNLLYNAAPVCFYRPSVESPLLDMILWAYACCGYETAEGVVDSVEYLRDALAKQPDHDTASVAWMTELCRRPEVIENCLARLAGEQST